MEDARVTFEEWFADARDQWHKAGFIEDSLDETVAKDAYNDGDSVDDFIRDHIDHHMDDVE